MIKDRLSATTFCLELWLVSIQTLLLFYSFGELPDLIPFFYTRPWGSSQLADKSALIGLPLFALLILIVNNQLSEKFQKSKEILTARVLSLSSLFLIATLTFFTFRIVLAVSSPELPRLINPTVSLTLGLSFALSSLLTYPSLGLLQRFGFVDNPRTHQHPAMLLTRAVPRGGSLPLFLGFLITSLVLFRPDPKTVSIFLIALSIIVVGLIDDKFDLNPYLRFSIQIGAAVLLVINGLQIDYINHPLGQGVLSLTKPVISLSPNFSISPLAAIFALVWITWTMNMISWSNGVDGQFPLITAVAAIVIGILGASDVNQFRTSGMAFALAGAALGTLPYSWHPSKILYGFGATGVGLVLAALSILNGTKIATALLVLLVPSLDALVTILRRIKEGRSPFWGDRAHFHHRLLDLGLSQPQIALFYGLAGTILGTLAIFSSGRGKLLAIITAAGIFISLITLVNWWTAGLDKGKASSENRTDV